MDNGHESTSKQHIEQSLSQLYMSNPAHNHHLRSKLRSVCTIGVSLSEPPNSMVNDRSCLSVCVCVCNAGCQYSVYAFSFESSKFINFGTILLDFIACVAYIICSISLLVLSVWSKTANHFNRQRQFYWQHRAAEIPEKRDKTHSRVQTGKLQF